MKYVSKRKELRLIMRPTDRSIDEHRRTVIHQGKKAEFMDGRYETMDPELIEWLHNHHERGQKFDEITPREEKAIAKAVGKVPVEEQVMQDMLESKPYSVDKPNPVIRVVTGAMATDNAIGDTRYVAPSTSVESTRPRDVTSLSPELAKIIDEKINAAIGQIIELLKPAVAKEEKAVKIMEGKSTKSFKCPYCDEVFSSGFAVGRHKREKHSK
uniref:C2H2-type domain-containing protein n=1 Tax=viral metagenome TaxID=1070528 RepID=A0A6M3IK31_9ZZZZ